MAANNMEETVFKTKNNLEFLVAQSPYDTIVRGLVGGPAHQLYKVGTCEGQWGSTGDSLFILSVLNKDPGNGHLDDLFEWFEYSAKEHSMNLMVLECENERFYDHLLSKRGFIALDAGKRNCIKIFNRKSYKKLIKHGNEVIKKGTLTCV